MIAAAVIALEALPFVALRRRTLASYFAVDLLTWLLAWILWLRIPAIDPWLGCIVVAVVKLATLMLFIATGREVRWSANRAALIAAVVYALVIPTTLRVRIDGDSPFYLLQTESLVHDRDLDLANQYARRDTVSGRHDLVPQLGDPAGPHGERYSRLEPFLALLMIPGFLIGKLWGAVATIALFGVLLVRSTIRWMEDEGVSDEAARAVFPFFAFAPPVLFYAVRIWPEVPGAFFFVEALRGVRNARPKRWIPALLGLVLVKLRFVLAAVGLLAFSRRRWIGIAIVIVPLVVMLIVSGSATSVHRFSELMPGRPLDYARGFCGLIADGMDGIAFQAPFYLFALVALTRWRSTPRGFRLGMLASLLYLVLLIPRGEWFGGWAPPLRYIVFLMPVLALGAASIWERLPRGAIAAVALWSMGLVIHGLVVPWRLFHIANGENALGEWLSTLYHSDFSRVFPSFIRVNDAAWIGFAVVVLVVVFLRWQSGGFAAALLGLAIAGGFNYAMTPGTIVELEDAHVIHDGGELSPELYQVMRVAYRGGWVVHAGESVSFAVQKGAYRLDAITGLGATFELAGRAYTIAPSQTYQTLRVEIPKTGRVTLRCVSGAVNLDRMRHE